MTRCIVYVTNSTTATMWCPRTSSEGDWNRHVGGKIPPGTENFAVASMDVKSGNYGWIFFRLEYNDTTVYKQIYFQLRDDGDCMGMGMSSADKSNVDEGRGGSFNCDMPSNGTQNADKQTDHGLMQWRPADSDADALGFDHWPCMYINFNRR